MKQKSSVYMYIAIFAIVIILFYCMQGFYESDTDIQLDTSLAKQRIEAEAQVTAIKYAPIPSGTLDINETQDTYMFELKFQYEDFDLDCKVEKDKRYIIQDNHKPTQISFSVNKEYCSSRSGYHSNVFWGSRYFRSIVILEISPNGKISYEIVIDDAYGSWKRFKKGIDINLNS